MKFLICLVVYAFSGSAFADLTMDCSDGNSIKMSWAIDSDAKANFSIEAPKAAYKMNGNAIGKMQEKCILQETFGDIRAFSTFQCNTMATSLILEDTKITDAIYARDHVIDSNNNGIADGKEQRAFLDALVEDETEFKGELSAFDLADEETPIELSSFSSIVTCKLSN